MWQSGKHPRREQKGSVLLLVVLLISLLAFIPIGVQLLSTSRTKVRNFANADAQALNIARAGLQDAVSWFRRQNNGLPVRSGTALGAPHPDAAFNPTGLDTIDPSIGLVKSGEMSPISGEGKLFYRYEVVRSTTGNPRAVHDITGERVEGHVAGEGLVWYIESVGYVYAQRQENAPINVGENFRLGKNLIGRARVATEIRRINFNPPEEAAVIINRLDNCVLNAGGFVAGGSTTSAVSGIGVAYNLNTMTPAAWTGTYGTRVSGNPMLQQGSYPLDIFTIFGLTPYEMSSIADYSSFADLPAVYPAMAVVHLKGNTTFTAARPLNGGGVLVVEGDLTINPNTNASFSGLILVTGNVTITGSANITGSMVVGGTLTITGGTEPGYIFYDRSALDSTSVQLARYRESKSTYHAFSAFK